MLPLLQEVAAAAHTGAHPLSGTAARWLWAVPLLPFLGFLINGALSLMSVYHKGDADPSAGHGDAHGAALPAGDEGDAAHSGGGHGDDHHAVQRHRFAGLT